MDFQTFLICRLFHVLTQFPFTAIEAKLDYHHQKVNVRVSWLVTKQLKTEDFRKLENFKKIAEKPRTDDKSLAGRTKPKFREWCYKITKNLL